MAFLSLALANRFVTRARFELVALEELFSLSPLWQGASQSNVSLFMGDSLAYIQDIKQILIITSVSETS